MSTHNWEQSETATYYELKRTDLANVFIRIFKLPANRFHVEQSFPYEEDTVLFRKNPLDTLNNFKKIITDNGGTVA